MKPFQIVLNITIGIAAGVQPNCGLQLWRKA